MGLIEVEFLRRVKGWFFPESQNPNNAGLFDHLEGWWGRFAVWAKLCLFVGIFVVLIAIWVCINPELAQFIGYLLGGLLLFRQIAISGKRATAAEKTAEAMQETAQSTEKGNIAERFKNAIEHLGHESASIRLGGIYALHHIAQEVKEYRERVFEILCAHIRETTTQAAYKPRINQYIEEEPTVEIQGILELLFIKRLGRKIYKKFRADLERANLKGAYLCRAYLRNANLLYVELDNANLYKADLHGSFLLGASFQEAHLHEADLRETNLVVAKFQEANLLDVKFERTNLQMADLTKVENLEVEQLLKAKTLHQAQLPDGMEEIIRQLKPELLENPVGKKDA